MHTANERRWRAALGLGLALWVGAATAHAATGSDPGSHLHWLPACPFLAWTGWPCPGCGMGRALVLLGQLRVTEAMALQPAAPALLVAAAVAALRPPHLNARVRDGLAAAALGLLVALWIPRVL